MLNESDFLLNFNQSSVIWRIFHQYIEFGIGSVSICLKTENLICHQVRWADLEERQEQEKMRAIGFVVGQTDWSRMMDPTYGENKLTQTKYI